MRIGILADIHEHVEELRKCLAVLQEARVDRLVTLGDVCHAGERIEETVALLEEAGVVGVWGNHDVGLAWEPEAAVRKTYSERVLNFMTSLHPRLVLEGCHFSHVEAWLDPHKIEDLWWFDGPPDTAEKVVRSFNAVQDRILFLGHFHRWLLATPQEVLPWRGEGPIRLEPNQRYLIVVHAVWDGRCALFDTTTGELVPFVCAG